MNQRNAEGALALLILLDQLPRNAFRDTARMFATDAQALQLARRAISAGVDRTMSRHRNPLLGRSTTADEQGFLDAGGFSG